MLVVARRVPADTVIAAVEVLTPERIRVPAPVLDHAVDPAMIAVMERVEPST
jgi:hypothetical protein